MEASTARSRVTASQTFTVTADETLFPAGTDVTVTAEVGAAEEVTVWLVDADDVSVMDGMVSFEADNDGNFAAGVLDAGDGIVITEIDGVAIPNVTSRTVDVVDGEVEVTVNSNAGATTEFVVLVAETDTAPELDEDGGIVEAFGVTSTLTEQDVAGLAVYDADSGDLVLDAAKVAEEVVNVEVRLLDLAPTDEDAALVGVDGTLEYAVVDLDPANDPYAGGADEGDDPDLSGLTGTELAQLVASGTVDVADGVAEFSFDGLADTESALVLARFDAVEDSVYDGSDGAVTFAPGLATTHGQFDFLTGEPALAAASVVDDDLLGGDLYAEVGSIARPSVELVDQFGDGLAGFDVVVDDGNGLNQTRTTDADGVATFAFSNDTHETDTLTFTILDPDDDIDFAGDVDGATDDGVNGTIEGGLDVAWYLVAPSDQDFSSLDIIVADTDSDIVYVAQDTTELTIADSVNGQAVLVDYSVADSYVDDTDAAGGIVSLTTFEGLLLPANNLSVAGAEVEANPIVFTVDDGA